MSRNGSHFFKLGVFLCLGASAYVAVPGQGKTYPKPPAPPKETVQKPEKADPEDSPERPVLGRDVHEKALAVDPNVTIKLPCVSQARIMINGWDRDEIRVFIRNGSKLGVRVLEKDKASGRPVWVLITSMAGEKRDRPLADCLVGDRIEIDVPMKASLAISARNADTQIDSVKKIDIKNVDGNVDLRNISGGIIASTYRGNLTVENSGGQISLETSEGNIVAYGVSPGQIGDTFKTKTSRGAITLQNVDHRQISANSVSGTVLFKGKFLEGGLYNFVTSDGAIKLAIPADSSCRIIASYGFGTFRYGLPLKIETQNVSEGGKSLVGRIGAGDATVNLTTSSGSVVIEKQQ